MMASYAAIDDVITLLIFGTAKYSKPSRVWHFSTWNMATKIIWACTDDYAKPLESRQIKSLVN